MKKLSVFQKLDLGATAVIIIANPFVIVRLDDLRQYVMRMVDQGLTWFNLQLMAWSGVMLLVAASYLGVRYFVKDREANKLHVPKKTDKTKSQKYVATPAKA